MYFVIYIGWGGARYGIDDIAPIEWICIGSRSEDIGILPSYCISVIGWWVGIVFKKFCLDIFDRSSVSYRDTSCTDRVAIAISRDESHRIDIGTVRYYIHASLWGLLGEECTSAF